MRRQLAGGQLAGDFLKVVLEFGFFNFIDTKHTGLNSSRCFTSTVIGIKGIFIYLFGVLRRFQHCTGHITVVERAEETSTYSSLGLCTVNCRPTASNYQLSHLRP